MQATQNSLANFLDGLSATLKEAAEAARAIHDRSADLPPTLSIRHIAEYEGVSKTTVWRKARLGEYGPLLSDPGEPVRLDRDSFLARKRRRREEALARMAEG